MYTISINAIAIGYVHMLVYYKNIGNKLAEAIVIPKLNIEHSLVYWADYKTYKCYYKLYKRIIAIKVPQVEITSMTPNILLISSAISEKHNYSMCLQM